MSYTKYPNSIDTSTELPLATDNVTPVKAEVVNRLREAILAIQNELGVNPSSVYGTVKSRLDTLDGYGGNSAVTDLAPLRLVVPATIINYSTSSAGYVRAGVVNFDPSMYKSSGLNRYIHFVSVLEVDVGGGTDLTCDMKLVNLDTGTTIINTQSTSTSVTPDQSRKDIIINVPDDIPDLLQSYEVQIKRIDGSSSDNVYCLLAQFEVDYLIDGYA